MRLLLTRATGDADGTRAKLEAAGHRVLLSPMIAIAGTGASWPHGVIDALLATSAQAFRVEIAGAPPPETRRVMPLYLVGERTKQAARARDFAGPATVAGTAAELAGLILAASAGAPRMVYLAGHDRKPDLETALCEGGCSPLVVEVYEAAARGEFEADAAHALDHRTLDGILHFSRRSASLFVDAARKAGLAVDRAAHFCLSEDVAVPLREAGCGNVRIAAAPREADLLSLLDPS